MRPAPGPAVPQPNAPKADTIVGAGGCVAPRAVVAPARTKVLVKLRRVQEFMAGLSFLVGLSLRIGAIKFKCVLP